MTKQVNCTAFAVLSTHIKFPTAFDSGRPIQDYSQAAAWAGALAGNAETAVFNWRFIHDQNQGTAAIKRRGTLPAMWQEACNWSAAGYGVFVTYNEMDGSGYEPNGQPIKGESGDKLHNVRTIRAHCVDLDNLNAMSNLQRAAAFNPAPSFAVQTSPGKAHVYWVVQPYQNIENYKLIQRKLCQFFDGDKAVIDATRVLRVPGFLHQKGAPHLVTCYGLQGFAQGTTADMLAISLAHVNAVDTGGGRHRLGDPALAAPSAEWLWQALDSMPVDGMSHPEFISFTAAWKQAGWGIADHDEMLQRFLAWCQTIPGAHGREHDLKHWHSITETELGWKSLLRQNPRLNAQFMFQGAQHVPPQPGQPQVPLMEQLTTAAFSVSDHESGKALIPAIMHLTEPEQETILKIIADKTGVSLGSWKRTLKDALHSEMGITDKDHSVIAERVLIEMGRDNLIRAGKDFWKYNGAGLWRKTNDAEIRKSVQGILKAGGHHVTQPKTTSISNVLADMIHVEEHRFNAAPKGTVGCPNGEISFMSGMWFLNPHKREHYRTTQIAVSFDYAAPEPTQTLTYLRACFRDDDDAEQKIEMLFALAGYALMDHADHAKFLILKGKGRNGKSVWMHILESLIGDKNTANVQPSEFNNRFQLGELDGKLLNIVDDLPKKALLPDGVIKAIVSGGKITGEHKQRDPFSVSFRCFLTIGTNYDLPTVDDSTAMMERAVIIEWNRTFRADERDDTLRHRLVAEELPGILRHALDAYGRALMTGFPLVPSSDRAKEKWLGRINPVRRFVDQEYDVVPGAKVLFQDLWRAYQQWEADERSHKIGKTGFGERLADIPGVTKHNNSANHNQVTIFGLQRRGNASPIPGQQPIPGQVVPFPIPGQMTPR